MSRAARIKSLVAADPALADRKAPDGFTALHLNAFFSGDVATARLLLDAGANPDAVADNETQVRPINSAAAAGSNHLVALLIERGADIEAAQRGGYTALHSAAANGNNELVDLLIEAGAEIDATAEDGWTPSELAEQRGHPELARELRARSAPTANGSL